MKNSLKYSAPTIVLSILFSNTAFAHNPGAFFIAGGIILLCTSLLSMVIKYLVARYLFKSENKNTPFKFIAISISEFFLIVISLSILVELQAFDHTLIIFTVSTLLYLLPATAINNLLLSNNLIVFRRKAWLKPFIFSIILPVTTSIVSIFSLTSLYVYFE